MNTLSSGTPEYENVKWEILSLYKVVPYENFKAEESIKDRVNYLKTQLLNTKKTALVLGISGGVDSTVAGKIAQIACSELREQGYPAEFIAMRLPAGIQKDEADAQEALKFISPDKTLTVNVGNAALEMSLLGLTEFQKSGSSYTAEQIDFNKGNIKSRMRMIALFHQASLNNGLVLGTSNNCEVVTGFFTKFADNAVDLQLLSGLNKRQVKLMAKHLGASERLWNKLPTADLEELKPNKSDEEALGFKYEEIDDFLEGKKVDQIVEHKIVSQYYWTQHKRAKPLTFKSV